MTILTTFTFAIGLLLTVGFSFALGVMVGYTERKQTKVRIDTTAAVSYYNMLLGTLLFLFISGTSFTVYSYVETKGAFERQLKLNAVSKVSAALAEEDYHGDSCH
jgi:hypothetical protein